jgi:hypothetical protein
MLDAIRCRKVYSAAHLSRRCRDPPRLTFREHLISGCFQVSTVIDQFEQDQRKEVWASGNIARRGQGQIRVHNVWSRIHEEASHRYIALHGAAFHV